ncbi:MAG TPA: efflux transporter outer membrane subunit, partial [Methylomirabilota bacterium]|nr:efflux transporter outer membrane subunit [Methylomirabilota bacterium]
YSNQRNSEVGSLLGSLPRTTQIVRLRFDNGIVPELDLRRAEGEAASASAQAPDLERRVAETENRLSVLLGRNPGPIARGGRLTEQAVLPEVPAGLPSALLQRRPDLRQAEQRLVAANARIGETKAAYFPRVNLTGAFGVESIALSDLFTGPARVWQFGPRITIPIFNAGKITSQVQTAEARTEQTLVQYQQSVQQAFREVEDALVGHRKIREIRPDREALVAANRRSLQIADLRYQEGLSTYLDVLDAQRQLFSSEIDLARTTRDQLTALQGARRRLDAGGAERGHALAAHWMPMPTAKRFMMNARSRLADSVLASFASS